MADSGHPPAELHERLLICHTIKLNAGAHGGHRRCCLAQMQKNAQNKPQIARLILCIHATLQVYCNLFLTFCAKARFTVNIFVNNVKLSLYVLDGRSVSAFESKGYDLYSVVVIRLYAAFGEEKSVQVLRLNAVVKFLCSGNFRTNGKL